MSQACGNLQFVEGGTIKSSSIINSQITDSIISNSTLQAVRLESLTSLDCPSAETIATAIASCDATSPIVDAIVGNPASVKLIADAIAALPPDQLVPLVNALLAAFAASPKPAPAVGTGSSELPTTVYGDRSALLGKPQMFVSFGPDYILPLYQSGV